MTSTSGSSLHGCGLSHSYGLNLINGEIDLSIKIYYVVYLYTRINIHKLCFYEINVLKKCILYNIREIVVYR